MAKVQHSALNSLHPAAYLQNTEPTGPLIRAGIEWTDTTAVPYTRKVRNAANSAWITVGGAVDSSIFTTNNYNLIGNGIAEDTAVMQAILNDFAASDKNYLLLPKGDFLVNNLTSTGLSNKFINGNGARLLVGTAGATGVGFVNSDNLIVHRLNVIGTGSGNTQKGFTFTNGNKWTVDTCYLANLGAGINPLSSATQAFGLATVPLPSNINNVTVEGCFRNILINAEYVTVQGSRIIAAANQGSGIEVRAGNIDILNNRLMGNWCGIYVDSSASSNGDHGLIQGNRINHNIACGILLLSLDYGMDVIGNEIWATAGNGTAAGDLGAGVLASSFGIYLFNTINAKLVGNTIARNKFNMGLDGHVGSKIEANTFIGDPTLTTTHIKENGSSNSGNQNKDNDIINNSFNGGLTAPADAIQLLTNDNSRSYTLTQNTGNDFTQYPILDAAQNYRIDGRETGIRVVTTTYSGTLTASATLLKKTFYVDFVGAVSKSITFPSSGIMTVTNDAGGSVSGAGPTYTFTAPGSYKFTPTASGVSIIKLA